MITYDDLNSDQKGAVRQIPEWIRMGIKQMSFTGAAGTGKTTTIRLLLEALVGEYKVLLLAPTHASRGVLEDSTEVIDEEGNSSRMQVSTTQSALGLRPDTTLEEFDPDNPEFIQIGPTLTDQYDIVIQEEASMINQDLMDLLVAHSNIIIFMGDECQLPPVGFNTCPALSLPHKITLKQVMRQKGDSTLKATLGLMRCIISEKCGYEYEDNSLELIDKLGLTGMPTTCHSLIEQVAQSELNDGTIIYDPKISDHILEWEKDLIDRDSYLFLAFTNKRVDSLNELCSNLLGVKPFREGYRVLVTKSFRLGRLEGITNNSRGRVQSISNHIIEYKIGRAIIRCFELTLNINSCPVTVLSPTQGSLFDYMVIHKDVMEYCINSKKWDSMDELLGNIQVFRNYLGEDTSKLLEDKFIFISTKRRPRQYIKAGYALTVHKSQGSTIPRVIVAFQDIAASRDLQDKLYYVALSRASERVYIV